MARVIAIVDGVFQYVETDDVTAQALTAEQQRIVSQARRRLEEKEAALLGIKNKSRSTESI